MSNTDPILPPEIHDHYEQVDEANRLRRPWGDLELVRTRELMQRYLPEAPAVVLDVGGAAGIHAFWLAEQGYDVHLIDALPRHIEQAQQQNERRSGGRLQSLTVGDARRLDFADNSADAVLLFGPLYHLTEYSDRLQALAEARRVLGGDGVLLAVAIQRFVSTISLLNADLFDDAYFRQIVERDVIDGQHRNPRNDPAYFTTGFFHHPDELTEEIALAGFDVGALLSVEGPARLLPNFADSWQQPERRSWLLNLVRQVESDPFLFGAGVHLMAVAHPAAQAADS